MLLRLEFPLKLPDAVMTGNRHRQLANRCWTFNRGEALKNTVVVVTRYFGGTLLGTGGLVRAYSAAVQEGLRESLIIEKHLCRKVRMRRIIQCWARCSIWQRS